jgi:type IV pilus assembly protein PilB
VDFRVAYLPTVFGEEMVLRMLDASSLEVDLTRLGFAPKILAKYEEVFRRPYGTIFLTGTTGSGKSTTLYATLGELNSQEKMIITVEDPVELWMQGATRYRPTRRSG